MENHNKENLKGQEANLSAEIHCSDFPREEILTTPHVSKGLHLNQCKNVAKLQKDNFKKLGTEHWVSILNRKEMLHMNSGNLPGCQKFDISYWSMGKYLRGMPTM